MIKREFSLTANVLLAAALLILVCAPCESIVANELSKYILLVSDKTVEEEKPSVTYSYNGSITSLDYGNTVKIEVHPTITLRLVFNCEGASMRYLNLPALQEDLAGDIAQPNRYVYAEDDEKSVQDFIKGLKSVDEITEKLSHYSGYKTFVFDNEDDYRKEEKKYPSHHKTMILKEYYLSLKGNVLEASGPNIELRSVYDVTTGKRILPADMFTKTKYVDNYNGDSLTIVSVSSISHKLVLFYCEKEKFNLIEDINDSMLTPYARTLMQSDKGYSVDTITNSYGDKILHFDCDFGRSLRKVDIPIEIKGCANAKAVLDSMLNVMFHRTDGNLEETVVNGIKQIPENYSYSMAFVPGSSFLSFAFDETSIRTNLLNTHTVFLRKSGEKIKTSDLIADKKGFMAFVNSHNLYAGGFLLDSTDIKRHANDEDGFMAYLKHSFAVPFEGITEFPTYWILSFKKMGEVFPIEFDNLTASFYLNYKDIRKFIHPKYRPFLDETAKEVLGKRED